MPVSLATYERVALEDDEAWEWRHGRLVKKPGGTHARNHTMGELMFAIHRQLDQQGIDDDYQSRVNSGRLIREGSYMVPDGMITPGHYGDEFRGRDVLEAYDRPVLFVLEVWCDGEGYQLDKKLAAYRAGGDQEIWLVQPYERWVQTWVRGVDGHYAERLVTAGNVEVFSLPNVTVNLDQLFRLME
jgi:Uma2 family endonuclease